LSVLVLGVAAGGGPPPTPPATASLVEPQTVVAPHASREQALAAYADLPLAFVENRGQTDPRARYCAQGSRHAFFFTPEAVVLSFVKESNASTEARGPAASARRSRIPTSASALISGAATISEGTTGEPATRGVTLSLRFLGKNPLVGVEGKERAPGEVNYFRGNNPSRWLTQLPRYAQVVYHELWPGVDLMLCGQAGELKYEFRLEPGARLADLRLAYAGAAGLTLDGGGLLIETALGVLRDSPPVAYQEIAGARVPVESRYVLKDGCGADGEYGFEVGAGYDPDFELIIDPGLGYSTFLGGASDDYGTGIAVDGSGNAYVVGTTQSLDFPTTAGAFDRALAGPSNPPDVFISKLSSTGSALIYSTYLGGGSFEFGRAIAVDAAGNAYVTGQTTSRDFPTTGGAFIAATPQPPPLGSPNDAFVTKLNATGSALVYSTFLGGGQDIDDGLGIAVDGAGNAYIAGETGSSDFPTTAGAFDRTKNGEFDAFVTKLNPTGSAAVYSTFLGGLLVDMAERVVIDGAGNAYVMGSTRSGDFPVTAGAFDTTHHGVAFDEMFDVFIAKLNPSGSALVFSTFLGGSKNDFGDGMAVDAAGNAYVTGGTLSPDFPTTPGTFDPVFAGTSKGFVTKLDATGSALVYSTFLGEAGASAITLDADGNAWLAGSTGSPTAVTTADGFDRLFNGGATDAYVAKLNATGSALLYATFLGGSQGEGCIDVALDLGGNVYVTGKTMSPDFPTTPGVLDTVFNGDPLIFWGDGFVTKLAVGQAPPPPPPPPPPSPPAPAMPSLLSPANQATVTLPITFDWSDAANATSYNLQIDNSNNFTTPLTLSRTVSVSQATVSSLPAQQLFWRVRGINSAGVTGPFSSSRRFTVQAAPPPPAPASLSALSVSPTSVVGGNTSQGTVTLTSAAPSGGAIVALSSSSTSATTPASVTVTAGSTTATFTVTTSAVSAATTATISGTFNAVTRTATLTVNPVSTGALPAPSLVAPAADARFAPGTAITFDWSDVAGAASYTIQIDDADTFPAPQIVNQTVAASQFTTSTLPTLTMWWRARANDAAGNPGSWSSVRRFEVKN
jgi:hypothetical protein